MQDLLNKTQKDFHVPRNTSKEKKNYRIVLNTRIQIKNEMTV